MKQEPEPMDSTPTKSEQERQYVRPETTKEEARRLQATAAENRRVAGPPDSRPDLQSQEMDTIPTDSANSPEKIKEIMAKIRQHDIEMAEKGKAEQKDLKNEPVAGVEAAMSDDLQER